MSKLMKINFKVDPYQYNHVLFPSVIVHSLIYKSSFLLELLIVIRIGKVSV